MLTLQPHVNLLPCLVPEVLVDEVAEPLVPILVEHGLLNDGPVTVFLVVVEIVAEAKVGEAVLETRLLRGFVLGENA